MPSTKVDELGPITGVQSATGDKVMWLDVSDTTQGAGGTLKIMTRAELVVALKIEDPTLSAPVGRVLLATIDNTAAANDFDFTTIPSSGYTKLVFEGEMRSDVGGTHQVIYGIINNQNTLTDYHRQGILFSNGAIHSATEGADPIIAFASGATSPANAFMQLSITLPNFLGTSKKQLSSEHSGEQQNDQLLRGGFNVSSSVIVPVTSVRFKTDNHPTNKLFGVMRMYGEV